MRGGKRVPAVLGRGALLLAALALPPALAGQEAFEAPAGELERALELIGAGDLAGAIAVLEPLAREPGAPPQVSALLGALLVESGRAEAAYGVLAPLAAASDADPAVLYNAGRAAAGLGQLEEAGEWLGRSAAADPASPAGRELGLILARVGQYEEAYAHLKPWVEAWPGDLEARTIAALCAVQLRRPNEAEAFLEGLPADRPEIRLLEAKVHQLQARPWDAIALLEPLLATAPPTMATDVRRQLAEAYSDTAQAAKAVEILTGHVEGDPSLALQLGLAQYQSGDLEGALATLAPVAGAALAAESDEEGPPRPSSLGLEYGRLLAAAGRHEEAVPYLEAATRLAPGGKEGWQQLGQALAVVGRLEEARAALERFQAIVGNEVPVSVREVQLEKDLADPTARELREALTLASDGRTDEALAKVRREERLVPGDPRPPMVESRVLLLADRRDEALAVAETVVATWPESADAVYQRGTVRMAMGDPDGAQADFRRAIELAPDHTAAMSDLAVLLVSLGEREEARALLEQVLALRPGDATAKANLDRLGPP